MVLKEFLARLREKKVVMQEAQTQDRVAHTVQERKKSSNERELERFVEENRQEQIKKQLHQFRERQKTRNREVTTLDKHNIFKNHKPILQHDKKLFGMNQGNMLSQGSMLNQGGMFFE